MSWQDLQHLCDVEVEADSESPDIASFSNDGARATLVLKLTPTLGSTTTVNLVGIIYAILGNSEYTASTATRMTRNLPLQHPMWGWMFASEISSLQGRGQKALKRAASSQAGAPVNWQAYDHYRAVVVFTGVKYAVLKDRSLNESELYRYVERHFQLGLENITRPGNSFLWGTGTPNAGQTIPFGFIARAQKGVVTYIWRDVTRLGLFGRSGDGWPLNIWDGVGKVNEDDFDGCLPGQLLLLPPKFIPKSRPFTVNDAVKPGTCEVNLSYDVELPMSYIGPPKDPAFNYEVEPRWARNGHNLFPPPPGQTTVYWYPATQTGTFSGDSTPTLYRPYDFNKLFNLMGTG